MDIDPNAGVPQPSPEQRVVPPAGGRLVGFIPRVDYEESQVIRDTISGRVAKLGIAVDHLTDDEADTRRDRRDEVLYLLDERNARRRRMSALKSHWVVNNF